VTPREREVARERRYDSGDVRPEVQTQLENLVAYVGAASQVRGAGGQPDNALAFAAGGLHVLHELGLITGGEFDSWLDRAREASGGDRPSLEG
jgi:hypothetical protein